MTWPDEIRAMAAEAVGDVGLLCALVALRRVENGGPGREFGVLSVPAPTYQDQLHVAAISLRHHERHWLIRVARDADGFYSDDFLRSFSAEWCPVGAANDPNALNRFHARNLVLLHGDNVGKMREAIRSLG